MADDFESLSTVPNEKYRIFFEKFKKLDSLQVSEWKVPQIIGYVCKKYKQQYGVDMQFKFNSPAPSKCFEVFQIKRLSMLLSKDPVILKEYIDWVFQNKVPQAKRRLTSISFLTHDETVQYYKMKFLFGDKKSDKVDRSTLLPDNYKGVLQAAGFAVQNYGDLAFLFQMERTPELEGALSKLDELGFDKNIIGKIV